MGTEARLRIMQLLLTAHPEGLVVGEIQEELGIPSSTLSHHLDKLRNEDLVRVQRESTFLRYTANTEALQELLRLLVRGVLHAESGGAGGGCGADLRVGAIRENLRRRRRGYWQIRCSSRGTFVMGLCGHLWWGR